MTAALALRDTTPTWDDFLDFLAQFALAIAADFDPEPEPDDYEPTTAELGLLSIWSTP